MGGSGASPGFSIGGAGSGTGGKSPGGTPGLGAGGLGTCCAWSASNFSKTKVLSLRAAHGAVVAFAGDAPANAFSPGGFRRARVTWASSIPRVAFRGRSGLFVDAADAHHVADIETRHLLGEHCARGEQSVPAFRRHRRRIYRDQLRVGFVDETWMANGSMLRRVDRPSINSSSVSRR